MHFRRLARLLGLASSGLDGFVTHPHIRVEAEGPFIGTNTDLNLRGAQDRPPACAFVWNFHLEATQIAFAMVAVLPRIRIVRREQFPDAGCQSWCSLRHGCPPQ